MHEIFLEHEITKEELLIDLKDLFKNTDFFISIEDDSFLADEKSVGIPVTIFENESYLRKQIGLCINNENDGFKYADRLAKYLSEKYNCDSVRELSTGMAIEEFNNKLAAQSYALLFRHGMKYIISEEGIQEKDFKLKVIKELKS